MDPKSLVKELVSKIAADIKNLKPVEPYKAKGIKEREQFILRKEGKKKKDFLKGNSAFQSCFYSFEIKTAFQQNYRFVF